MSAIAEKDFQRLVAFIQSNYGINLSQKKHLIEGRLSNTIKGMGLNGFSEYVDHIMKKNPDDIEILINKLTTNHTFFMRENSHFEFFKNTILPYLEQTKKNKVLSIWSAGCSSGEEPYTLSMILKDYFRNKSGWDTKVLATDISQRVLEKAKAAIYEGEALKDIPEEWKKKYFTKMGDSYMFVPEIKNNVIFRTFNLLDPIRFKLNFDVIFCRNVMIYFDQDTKDALIQRFYNATNKGGYLLIGHSETVNKSNSPYQYIMPAAYRKV